VTSEWEHFIAGLTPALLERERARVHGDLEQERVGSRADLEMRFAHDYVRFQVAARQAETTEARRARIRRVQEADADRFIAQREAIEAAIRSYSQQHNERHAA
jgi:hypothetical protein